MNRYEVETSDGEIVWAVRENVDCVRYLEKNKNIRPYKKYRDVIEEIINRVPDILEYRNNVKNRSIYQTENSIKNIKKTP